MKTSVLQTLKSVLYLIPSFLILLFAVNSCKKEDSHLRPLEPLIAEAKNYFDTQIATRSDKPIDDNPRHQVAKKPLWNKAYTKTISIGQAVIVPLEYSSEIFTKVGKNQDKVYLKDISYLMLYKDKQGKLHAEVVTHIPDDEYWDSGKAAGKDFSGIVMVEDWWGKTIKIFRKETNRAITYLSRPSVSRRGSNLSPRPGEMLAVADEPCEITVWTNERGMYEVELICNRNTNEGGQKPDEMPPGDHDLAGGGGENGLPSGDYGEELPPHGEGGGGSGSGDNNPPPPNNTDIVNNLPAGCLKNVVNELIQKDCKNELSSMINQVFNISPELDLVISGRASFSNDIDGDASTQLGVDGYCKINIDLNTNVLPDAAKEYIAATMFHESIHAYLGAISRISDLDHQVMAELYISKMAAGIQELYPSISLQDAEALSWGGLQRTAAWSNLQNSNPAKANDIAETNNNYRNGHIGNVCNVR